MPVVLLKKLPLFLIIGDYLIINLFYFLGVFYFLNDGHQNTESGYMTQFVVLNFSWYIISRFTRLYHNVYYKEAQEHFSSFTKNLLTYAFFIFLYINLYYANNVGFAFSLRYLAVITFAMFLNRVILLFLRKRYRFRINRLVNTVLIGHNSYSRSVFSNKWMRASMGVRGYYSIEELDEKGKYLGDIHSFMRDLNSGRIDNVIISDNSMNRETYDRILQSAENQMVRIYFSPDFKYIDLGAHDVEVVQGVPFLRLMPEPLLSSKKQFIKRTFDVVFSLFVIIFILSWLLPIVALIIKLESPGPVFFVQKRSGLKNETFNCIKFRSMCVNAVADTALATKNDARVTKFGAFMRKTSIDELPQFFNVLIGNMSVVGPRPHMLSQTRLYSRITKKYMLRHIVKPGITGWAQVMGARGEIFSNSDMQKRVEKDMWYIQNWSFFLDLKIIFLTFYNMVKGDDQAY